MSKPQPYVRSAKSLRSVAASMQAINSLVRAERIATLSALARGEAVSESKAHYVRLWKKADEILKQPDNPCQIRAVGNGLFTCAATHEQPSKHLCCTGCKHVSDTGCTVMALGCKLHWCYTHWESINQVPIDSHPTFVALAELRAEAKRLKLPLHGRRSFEDTYKER